MKIDKKIITNLREEYGDAFYLLDSEQFQKNFIELRLRRGGFRDGDGDCASLWR